MKTASDRSQLPPIYIARDAVDEEEEEKDQRNSHEHANSRDLSTPANNEGGDSNVQTIETPEKEKNQEYYEELQKQKLEEELEHTSKDMWFTKLIVQKTWIVLVLSVIFIIFITVLCIALGGFELSEEHSRDYLVWDSKIVQEWDMYELAKEAIQTNYANGIQPLRTTVMDTWVTSVTFECSDCETILTAEYIKEMYAMEQLIVNSENYVNFCKAVSSTDSSCDPAAYGSFSKNFAGSINTLTQSDVDTFLASVAASDTVYQENNIYLESTFTQTNLKSKKARAIYLFASPFELDGKRYKSYTDEEAKQDSDVADFSEGLIKELKDYETELHVQFFNNAWYNKKINEYVMSDFGLAVASFIFVLIYVSFHLKSTFLAGCAMGAIAFSYPISIFVNRFIFQVDFFQTLNFIAVFVILGISADNVFVITDTWQQSGQYETLNPNEDKHKNFQKRMNHTWRGATKAVSTTSFTTIMAFIATGFSKIMPISAFGFFAATLVAVNYVFAIVTFPACLIFFERHLAHRCRYRKFIGDLITKIFSSCKSKKIPKDNSISPQGSENGDQEAQNEGGNAQADNLQVEDISQSPAGQDDEQQVEKRASIVRKQSEVENVPEAQKANVSESRWIEVFFKDYWNKYTAKFKWIIIPIVLIWVAIAIWRVTEFKPATEAVEMLPESHYLSKLVDSLRNDYHTGENDDTIKVSMIWGIKGLDRNGVGTWEADNRGTIVWDSDFDMSSTANQQRILDICNDLKSNALVKSETVTCWVQDFVDAQNGGSPVAQANFYTELETYLQTTDGQNQYSDNQIGYINGTLYFSRIEALSQAKAFTGYSNLYPVYEDWEDLKNQYNKNSPSGVNNALQTAEIHWAFLISEKEFVNGAIQGTIIALSFAFAVLLISTLNIVIAIYATLSISGIVVSVIAIMELFGWTLGVIESIAIVILIGFSVDYAVHLANHYVESVYDDRFRRMQDALGGIGISIVSGAVTTIGSGFFLFFAQVVFFQKFAVLITFTIFFSLFFSLVFFTAIIHAFGPQKNFGNLKYYIIDPAFKKVGEWIKKCFKKDTEEENNPNEDNNEAGEP
jgi:predicted RND superfamily exporter protein